VCGFMLCHEPRRQAGRGGLVGAGADAVANASPGFLGVVNLQLLSGCRDAVNLVSSFTSSLPVR
jgi:hypothetical protein